MIYKFFLILMVSCLAFLSEAQNLIPNPSFEDKISCPWGFNDRLNSVNDWLVPSGHEGTSDYFHQCATFQTLGVPNNFGGHRPAHDGLAYVGFINSVDNRNYKEYASVKLNSALRSDTRYKLVFYYSVADSSAFICNDLCIALSPKPFEARGSEAMDVAFIWKADTVIKNGEWVKVCFEFEAEGKEEYLLIGGLDYKNQQVTVSTGSVQASYIFVDDFSLEAIEESIVNMGMDTTICDGDSIWLIPADSFESYTWSTGDTVNRIQVFEPGKYTLQVSKESCSSEGSVVLHIEDCQAHLEMPNVFTPNSDGFNDRFEPIHAQNLIPLKMSVYNRWGNRVYLSDKFEPGWDGHYKGALVPSGNYYWILVYKDHQNKIKELSGSVMVIP